MPQRIESLDVSIEELEQLVDCAGQGPLQPEGQRKLRAAVATLVRRHGRDVGGQGHHHRGTARVADTVQNNGEDQKGIGIRRSGGAETGT